MSKHITFDDLRDGFPEFKERFHRAKHEPFFDAHIIAASPGGYRISDLLEGKRVALEPETDFVAKIVLAPRCWDWYNETGTYTYYITKTGAIKFKAPALFPAQPKTKWATIINRWLHASMPLYRQLERTEAIRAELLRPADNADSLMELI